MRIVAQHPRSTQPRERKEEETITTTIADVHVTQQIPSNREAYRDLDPSSATSLAHMR